MRECPLCIPQPMTFMVEWAVWTPLSKMWGHGCSILVLRTGQCVLCSTEIFKSFHDGGQHDNFIYDEVGIEVTEQSVEITSAEYV